MGETVALIGPSGCGKTTALKLVNRLLDADGGTVNVLGRDVRGEDPVLLRRKLGYVIQEGGLFPHWDVRANVETVPRLLGWEEAARASRCDEVLAMVNLPAGEVGARRPRGRDGPRDDPPGRHTGRPGPQARGRFRPRVRFRRGAVSELAHYFWE